MKPILAVAAITLASCQPNADKISISSALEKCHSEAERLYPRVENGSNLDLYNIVGPASEYAKTCMKIAGYNHGGQGASRECFQAPIGSAFKPACYWPEK